MSVLCSILYTADVNPGLAVSAKKVNVDTRASEDVVVLSSEFKQLVKQTDNSTNIGRIYLIIPKFCTKLLLYLQICK